MQYNKEVLILGTKLKLSFMLKQLYLKLRYINQERRMNFIKENPELILTQKGKTNQYDVKYWKNGFSSVFSMKNINVIGYLSKYIYKFAK